MTSPMQDIYQLSSLFKIFSSTSRKKEKLDYILEPLQAMTQICLLSNCPIGSKLTIHDNLLKIQLPCITQGIVRYFNEDTKDDLYYLFNVFRRFLSYYKHLDNSRDNLLTYNSKNKNNKNKNNPRIITNNKNSTVNRQSTNNRQITDNRQSTDNRQITDNKQSNDNIFNYSNDSSVNGNSSVNEEYVDEESKEVLKNNIIRDNMIREHFKRENYKKLFELVIELCIGGLDKLIQTYTDSNKISVLHTLQMYKIMLQKRDFFENQAFNASNLQNRNIDNNNIDNIFNNITNIYGHEDYEILLNLLTLCKKNKNNYDNYITACNSIFKPNNDKIKKWINDNIAL